MLNRLTKSNRSSSRTRQHRLESLEKRQLLTAAPLISEFMAVNDSTLADQDGEFSDWLELVNAGDEQVNLDGYWLTDDPANLSKWRIPAVTLDTNEYVTIFASSKDLDDPTSELHTNFRLRGDGEFLALVDTDGTTIVHEFNPEYPTQVADIAYGVGTNVDASPLLVSGANATYMVPTDDALQESWFRPDFDDSGWKSGPTGIGYDTGVRETDQHVESVFTAEPLGYWRLEETAGTVAVNDGSAGADWNATYEGELALEVSGPTSSQPTFGLSDGNSAALFDGTDDAVSTGQSLLNNVAEFTIMGFAKPGELEGTNLSLFGQDIVAEFGFRNADTLRLSTRAGGRLDVDYTFPMNEWHHFAAVGTGANLQIYVDGKLAGEGGSPVDTDYGTSDRSFNIGAAVFSSSGAHFTGQIDEVALFDRALTGEEIASFVSHEAGDNAQFADLIATDIQADWSNASTSLYTRMPFIVDDAEAFNQLLMNVQYDDGFIAYLNGAEILRVNAPGESDVPLEFNATATETRFDSAAAEFEVIDITSERDLLIPGENLLAIHLLNLSSDNPDLLLVPEIEAAVVTIQPDQVGYLTTPTPNERNNPTSAMLGPVVGDVANFPLQPSVTDEVIVRAEIVRTLEDVADVGLAYRVMFGDEITVAMTDDGSGSDSVANDGIYTAKIPAGVAQPGEMLRWRIDATDVGGAAGRGPKFEFQTGNNQDAEYYGTMIADPTVTSEIPILHWFVEEERRAGQEVGTRASLFYDGEFHDNIYVRQRGGSTRNNSVGKTNFKFDFKGAQFRFDPAYARVEEFNINTTASDKAYARQPMSFEAYSVMGAPGSVSFPMHVQRNGEFYGVFAFIEEPSTEMLEREGLDPNGALYKMRNEFTGATGNDKKTRRDEDFSDLDEFQKGITRLEGEELNNFIFDTVDIPAVLNYLVATVLVHQNDNPHKNHFLYRDTEGSGEWLFLPWDNDLTWGSNWAGNSFLDIIYADMDEIREGPVPTHDLSVIHPSHPFINNQFHREWNNHWNRLMDAVLNNPTTREMYLRRLRSGMDLYLGPPGTTDSYFDRRWDEHVATMPADAQLDYEAWANPWKWGEDQSFQQAVDIIKTEYLEVRRQHLYVNHSIDRLTESDFTILVEQNSTGKYFVPGDDALGTSWTNVDFDDAAWQEGQAGFGFDQRDRITEHIKTTVNPRDTVEDGTSLFVRMPFVVDDPADSSRLLLQLQYDDAVVVYLNGTEVLRAGVADDAELTYNLRPRSRGTGVESFVNFKLDEHADLLNAGENVLAIHAVNRTSSSSDDLLVSPILIEGFFPTVEIAGIPHGQEDNPAIRFDATNYDANPVSGNQDEEFIKLDNSNDVAVDVSGWKITGGIEHVFKPGTVIPAGGSIFVSPDVKSFRARATGPSGGQGLFLQGNYQGHLSNFGETLQLLAGDGSPVDTFTTPANPSDLQQFLRISEIHYNPAGLDDSTEFIELQNISADQSLDLSGVSVSQGPSTPYSLPQGTTLGAGEYLVIASDPANLQAAHTTLDPTAVLGPFEGNLSNQGERIKLDDATGNTIVEFVYNDADIWPESADGAGASLVVRDVDAISIDTYSKHYSWRGSLEIGGSPGAPAATPPTVVINEIVSNNTGANPATDAIELMNTGTAEVDVSGWYLSDSSDNLSKYQIPAGTLIPAGDYLVIDESQFNPRPENPGANDFALSGSNGDDVWLSVSNGSNAWIVDDVHFGATLPGESFSRWPDGEGRLTRTASTIGATNDVPIASTISITEVQYNPDPPSAAALLEFEGMTNRDLEFLEITNFQSESVDLADWRIRGGIEFEFAAGTQLEPSQSLVVLPFNPENPKNVGRLDAFVAHYAVDESVMLIGGFQGQLSDSEDRIELRSPDGSDGGDIAHTVADEVLYDDRAPWPENADGSGFSIQRGEPGTHGSDATIWIGLAPTPGVASIVDLVTGDFDQDGTLSEGDIVVFCAGFRDNNLDFDINRDGKVDGVDRQILIFDLFNSTYGDSNLDGIFNSGDLTVIFQRGEYEDADAGNSTWSEGDWDCDGDFTTRDFVLAFQQQSGEFAATAYDPTPGQSVVASAMAPAPQTEKDPDQRVVHNSELASPHQDRLNVLPDIHVDTLFEDTLFENEEDEEFLNFEYRRELGVERADEFSNRE